MSTIGNEAVSKNSGADVGIRRRINFVEGANVTLTIADDPANHEVDVTIAAAGALGTAWVKQFYPASDPDGYYGTYASMLMLDGEDTVIRQTFMIPNDIATVSTAYLIIIPEASGNIRRRVDTNFAQVCVDLYQANVDLIAAGQVAVVADTVECLDFSAALTGATGDDIVGIEFLREASNILDDIDANVHFLGILIEGTV